MSLKDIYNAILGQLPTSYSIGIGSINLQTSFFFGARHQPRYAGPARIIFVPAADTYTPRRRQGGQSLTPELYSYEAVVEVHFEAPLHEDIDKAGGMRDLFVAICDACFAGSFRPVTGEWDNDNGSAQQVRGEHYILRVAFMRPVTAPDITKAPVVTTVQGGHFEEPGPPP